MILAAALQRSAVGIGVGVAPDLGCAAPRSAGPSGAGPVRRLSVDLPHALRERFRISLRIEVADENLTPPQANGRNLIPLRSSGRDFVFDHALSMALAGRVGRLGIYLA